MTSVIVGRFAAPSAPPPPDVFVNGLIVATRPLGRFALAPLTQSHRLRCTAERGRPRLGVLSEDWHGAGFTRRSARSLPPGLACG